MYGYGSCLMSMREPAHKMVVRLIVFVSALVGQPALTSAISGNEWQTMNSTWRSGYVAGVLDGWAQAASEDVTEGKSDSVWIRILSCITTKKIPYRQVAAAADKYVREHPEQWHEEVSTLIYLSMVDVCKAKPSG
jgi:hypothetical protein